MQGLNIKELGVNELFLLQDVVDWLKGIISNDQQTIWQELQAMEQQMQQAWNTLEADMESRLRSET